MSVSKRPSHGRPPHFQENILIALVVMMILVMMVSILRVTGLLQQAVNSQKYGSLNQQRHNCRSQVFRYMTNQGHKPPAQTHQRAMLRVRHQIAACAIPDKPPFLFPGTASFGRQSPNWNPAIAGFSVLGMSAFELTPVICRHTLHLLKDEIDYQHYLI